MSIEIDTKIQKVVRLVHRKGIVTADLLRKEGVSYQSMLKYRHAHWLVPLGTGAFCASEEMPSLETAIKAMSEQLDLPVHIGGKSALLRQGIIHYVPLGGASVILYLSRNRRLPKWFATSYAGQFTRDSSCLFTDKAGIEIDSAGIAISSPERAFLEMAADVPNKASIEELFQLMELADTLRPQLVEEMLVKCKSIKAKRIFLLLGDDIGHWWIKKINRAGIDLGSGCRIIEKGGVFHPKYNIVVKSWRGIDGNSLSQAD